MKEEKSDKFKIIELRDEISDKFGTPSEYSFFAEWSEGLSHTTTMFLKKKKTKWYQKSDETKYVYFELSLRGVFKITVKSKDLFSWAKKVAEYLEEKKEADEITIVRDFEE